MSENSVNSEGISQTGAPGSRKRDQDALYQNGEIVARVVQPQLDLEAKEIRFDELVGTDHLVLADECEYQKYRIMIQKVAFAIREDRRPGHQGRSLGGCTAEILGYVEQ